MSTIATLPSTSKEFLHIPVTASATISGYPVEIALMAYGTEPASGDWKTAAWDDGNAKILVGPDSPSVGALVEGVYGVWVRVTTPDERPVMYSGILKIT